MADKKAYKRWNNLKFRVLDPAVKEINDFGTVKVTMTPERTGRAIDSVRFTWKWKTIDEVRITDEENERTGVARHKTSDGTAPPLTDAENERQAQITADRDAWKAWEAEHGGTYGQYLDWKKANA